MAFDAASARGPAISARPDEVDRATLVRCKARDPIAFRAFVVRYERSVFALLSRILGRGPHVEDLAQETLLRAYRAFATFDVDSPSRPSSWLLTIATRLALDSRKKKSHVATSLDSAADVAETRTPETERARRELGHAIEAAAAALPDDQRAAFVLAEFHGASIAEIADALDVPEATAKTRLFRAREKLRDALRAVKEQADGS